MLAVTSCLTGSGSRTAIGVKCLSMSGIVRMAALVAALAALLATAPAAGAVTWHNTGSSAFHAVGGTSTLSVATSTFTCSGSTLTGTSPVGSFATTYTMTATLSSSPCPNTGANYAMHCDATFSAQAWAAGPPAVTAGPVALTCDITLALSNTTLCHVSGSTPAAYANPFGSMPGRVTFAASTTLTMSNGATACWLGTGAIQWPEQTLPLTTAGPVITRTP